MYACICRGVTQTEVRACVVHDGASSVDDIGEKCGAGTGCGMCHDRLQAMLLAHRATDTASLGLTG